MVKVILAGRVRVRADRRAEFLAAAQAVTPPSRAEEGCISYSFFIDGTDDLSALWFEEWRSRADLDAHFQTPHFLAFAETMPEWVDGEASISVFQVAGEETL